MLDDWDDFDDDWEEEEEDMEEYGEESPVDMDEIDALAARKRIFHYTCTIGCFDPSVLLTEAELCLAAGDYHSALVCARAAEANVSAAAVSVIALYQLGDKSAALAIVSEQETAIKKANNMTKFLKQKFVSTVEVLRFMPELLAMLRRSKNT